MQTFQVWRQTHRSLMFWGEFTVLRLRNYSGLLYDNQIQLLQHPRVYNCSTQKSSSKKAFNDQDNSRTLLLNNGNIIPCFGLGVWLLDEGLETENAVSWALECGYRQIDTASRYGNERSVGKAVRESSVPRHKIFVTTKVYDDDHGYEATMRSFEKSVSRLGLDYVDLYLIHSPRKGKILSTWEAMIKLKEQEVVRTIGVSNFGIHHLDELKKATDVYPSVNQIEVHPFLQEKKLVKYCVDHNITIQAYSPLAHGRKFKDKVLVEIAKKYDCNPALILIQWCLAKGYVCIPKSSKKFRIAENITACDLVLEDEDLDKLDSLDEGFRTCHNKIKLPWID